MQVKTYRKKPVEIEAMVFTEEHHYALSEWMNHDVSFDDENGKFIAIIPTLEGDHIANDGDYIIKGVKGEFYPCKPDIFKMTYDEMS